MSNQANQSLKKAQKSPAVSSDEAFQESPIQERIQAWKEKKGRDETGVNFTASLHPEKENAFNVEQKLNSDINKAHCIKDVVGSLYSTLSGSGNEAYSDLFISEASAAMINNNSADGASSALNAFQGGMISMNPQDVIEAQLCAKLMVLHSKAMLFMSRTTIAQYQKNIDHNLNNATKCMRLHNETLEALNRYKRKGEQLVKVVHQYVQVNEGGQAVVTGEMTPGGGKKKKVKE